MKSFISIAIISSALIFSCRAQIREETLELRVDDCTLTGTLTLPSGQDYSTVALLVSRSNNADRDGNESMKRNYALKLMSIELAHNGIASFRYDKRGVGASRYPYSNNGFNNGSQTISTHANDIKKIVESLLLDKRFIRVVVIGHGEGSLLAMVAISRGAPASGFISLEGIGRSYDQKLRDDLASQPVGIRDVADAIIDSLKIGKHFPNVPSYLASFFAPNMQAYQISSMKYNPQLLIRSLKIPVLIIHGDTDITIKIEDARILNASHPGSKLVIIAGMNHALKDCPTLDRRIQATTFSDPARPLSKTLVPTIVKFIDDL